MNYRKIYELHFGSIPKDEEGRSYEIHHIDGNHNNNHPENLKCVTIQEHYNIHLSQGDLSACNIISIRMKSKPLSGFTLSEDHKKKISESASRRKGETRSNEARLKMSESQKGKCLSEETKKKISETLKKKLSSEEKRLEMSKFQKGIPRSEEVKRKISESKKGKPKSEEHKKKIAESIRLSHKKRKEVAYA